MNFDFLLRNKSLFKHQTGLYPNEFDEVYYQICDQLSKQTVDGKKLKMKSGRPRSLDTRQQLMMCLMWMRRNYSLEDLRLHFNISVSRCFDYNKNTLNILYNCFKGTIEIPATRNEREKESVLWRRKCVAMILDGSEQQIRVYRKNKLFEQTTFSGKKQKHTFTKRIAVTPKFGKIIALSDSYNGCHNDAGMYGKEFHRFEDRIDPDEYIGGDPAFAGISHPRIVNLKRTRGQDLTQEEEEFNNDWASTRIVVENTISKIKNWTICKNILYFVGTPSDGRALHDKLWVVASVFVNRFSLPRAK